MREMKFKAYFAFCGAGGGALGFQRAGVRLLGQELSFRVLGGFDIDKGACANFRYLTDVEALCADVREITPAMLRASAGDEEPDVVFGSAPCVGASKLITDELANTPKYRALNDLTLVWTKLMLETWRPRIIIYENVPNVIHRARAVITEVRKLLKAAGYLTDDRAHELGEYGPCKVGGHYDAGVLGGLAQRRKRWLFVARLPERCAPLLYKPPKRRVRGIGEVIGLLPLPEDPAGGHMHKLPRLSVMNWLRLALIPAGGDWRDLPGVLAQEQERRAVHRRQHVARWEDPSVTIGGPGSNGPVAVADPRVVPQPNNTRAFEHKYRVEPWDGTSHAVTGADRVGSGAPSVADPRVPSAFPAGYGVSGWSAPLGAVIAEANVPNGRFSIADPRIDLAFNNKFRVSGWSETCGTVTAAATPAGGSPSVADPRLSLGPNGHTNILHVTPWEDAARAVTGAPRPSNGATSIADPRLGCEPHSGAYGITGWGEAAHTITGAGQVDNARQAVADPRAEGFRGILGVVPWGERVGTITGNARPQTGSFSVADPRVVHAFDKGYAVVDWSSPSNTIAGTTQVGCGTYSVADPRPQAPAGWLTVDDVMVFLETPGPWAIVDRLSDGPPLAVITDLRKPAPMTLRIVARDGTWHRPLTTLELGVLQALPARHRGAPLQLIGTATANRKHIGNLVPSTSAMAIAEQMLIAIGQHELGAFALSGAGGVWVDGEEVALQ